MHKHKTLCVALTSTSLVLFQQSTCHAEWLILNDSLMQIRHDSGFSRAGKVHVPNLHDRTDLGGLDLFEFKNYGNVYDDTLSSDQGESKALIQHFQRLEPYKYTIGLTQETGLYQNDKSAQNNSPAQLSFSLISHLDQRVLNRTDAIINFPQISGNVSSNGHVQIRVDLIGISSAFNGAVDAEAIYFNDTPGPFTVSLFDQDFHLSEPNAFKSIRPYTVRANLSLEAYDLDPSDDSSWITLGPNSGGTTVPEPAAITTLTPLVLLRRRRSH